MFQLNHPTRNSSPAPQEWVMMDVYRVCLRALTRIPIYLFPSLDS